MGSDMAGYRYIGGPVGGDTGNVWGSSLYRRSTAGISAGSCRKKVPANPTLVPDGFEMQGV